MNVTHVVESERVTPAGHKMIVLFTDNDTNGTDRRYLNFRGTPDQDTKDAKIAEVKVEVEDKIENPQTPTTEVCSTCGGCGHVIIQ